MIREYMYGLLIFSPSQTGDGERTRARLGGLVIPEGTMVVVAGERARFPRIETGRGAEGRSICHCQVIEKMRVSATNFDDRQAPRVLIT